MYGCLTNRVWGACCFGGAWVFKLNQSHRGNSIQSQQPPLHFSHHPWNCLIQPPPPLSHSDLPHQIKQRARVMILCWWCWHFFGHVLLLPSLVLPPPPPPPPPSPTPPPPPPPFFFFPSHPPPLPPTPPFTMCHDLIPAAMFFKCLLDCDPYHICQTE